MSNDERESPRKAIRNWLLHTNNERIARTSEDEDRDDKGLGEHDPPRRPTRHRGSVNADTNKRNRKNDATPLQILKDNGRKNHNCMSTSKLSPADYDEKTLRSL